MLGLDRVVCIGHRVEFWLHVLGWFEIEFCVHIDFYIIVNPFLILGQIWFGYSFGQITDYLVCFENF